GKKRQGNIFDDLAFGGNNFAHTEHGHYILGHDENIGWIKTTSLLHDRKFWYANCCINHKQLGIIVLSLLFNYEMVDISWAS
ncbi:MAG: hypothetical protein U1E13_13950, partial [Methylophilaceae bacterium]|nr:hypothetical protein [Methylophilaceae bacterium]